MICIPGATPIVLRDVVPLGSVLTSALAPRDIVLKASQLQHPEDRGMIIDEILFVGIVDSYTMRDLALVLEVDLSLGNWHLTDGFVPIGLFDKVNPIDPTRAINANVPVTLQTRFQDQSYYLWRLTDPVYVPQGMAFNCRVRHNPNDAVNWAGLNMGFSFVVRGQSLPAGHKVPAKTSVPWATAADRAIPQAGGAWMSDDTELRNTIDKAMQLDYMVGKYMVADASKLLRGTSLGTTAAPASPTIRLVSSAWDTDPVPQALPFNTVFCPQTDKLWLGRPMDIGERITAEIFMSDAQAYTSYLGLSLVGRRFEEIL